MGVSTDDFSVCQLGHCLDLLDVRLDILYLVDNIIREIVVQKLRYEVLVNSDLVICNSELFILFGPAIFVLFVLSFELILKLKY